MTHQGKLPLSQKLSERPQKAMVLLHLRSASPISLVKLCDDNCKVILTQKKLYAIKNNKLILKGNRNLSNGLWGISIEKRTSYNNKTALPITNPTISPNVAPHTLPTMPYNASYNLSKITKTNPSLSVIIHKKETHMEL